MWYKLFPDFSSKIIYLIVYLRFALIYTRIIWELILSSCSCSIVYSVKFIDLGAVVQVQPIFETSVDRDLNKVLAFFRNHRLHKRRWLKWSKLYSFTLSILQCTYKNIIIKKNLKQDIPVKTWQIFKMEKLVRNFLKSAYLTSSYGSSQI